MLKRLQTTILTVLLCGTPLLIHAQAEDFSPWDAWRKGYSFYERAEKAQARNEARQALEAFLQARDYYLAVKKARPDWNQQIIDNRIKMCNREINALRASIDKTAIAQQALPPPLQDSAKTTTSREIVTSHANAYEITRELEKYKKEFLATVAERDKLKQEVERNRSTRLEIANLIKEKAALEQRLANLRSQNELLAAKQDEPEKEKKELQNRLLEERMKLDIVNQRLKLQDSEVDKLKKEIADLLTSRNEFREKADAASKKILVLERQVSDASKLAQLRQQEMTKLAEQYADLQKDADIQKVRVKNQQNEITRLGSTGSQTAAQQLKESRELAKKLTESSVQNERLTKESADLRKQNRETGDELKSMKEAVVTLTDQRDQTAQAYRNLTEQHTKALELKNALAKQVAELTKKNQEIDTERREYVDKYEKAQKRLETRLNSEYENVLALTKQVREEQEKLRQSSEELDKLRASYTKSQDNNVKLTETIQELKDRLTTQDDAGKQLLSVSADLRKLKEEYKQLQEANQKLDQENRDNAILAARFKTASEQLKQLTQSKAELDTLKLKHQQALETIAELKKTQAPPPVQTAAVPVDSSKLKEAEQKIAEYEKKLADNNELLKDSRAQLKESSEQQTSLSRQLAEANGKLTDLNSKIRKAEADLKELPLLKKQLDLLKDSLTAANNRLKDGQESLKELASVKKQLTDLRNKPAQQPTPPSPLPVKTQTNDNRLVEELRSNATLIASLREELAQQQKAHRMETENRTRIQSLLKIQEEKNLNAQNEIIRLGKELKQAEIKIKTSEKLKQEYAEALNNAEKLQTEITRSNGVIVQLRQNLEETEKALKEKDASAGSDELLRRQLAAASEIHRRQLGERDARITQFEQRIAMNDTARKQVQNDLEEVRRKLAVLEATRQSELAAIENFNRTFSADLAKAVNNKPRMTPDEISFHATELQAVGESAEKEDEIDVALWNYRKILEFDPENANANARIGSICLKKGMYREAADHFNIAMKKGPLTPRQSLEYSQCLFETRDYMAAEKLLGEAVRKNTSDNDLRSAWASALTNLGQTAEAEKELRAVLKREPGRTDTMAYLAEALAESGRKPEAEKLYRQARKLGSAPIAKLEKLLGNATGNDDAKAFLYQSAAEAEKNNDAISAIWYYAQIRKLEGEQSPVANRLALMQLENGKPEEALDNIRNRREDPESQLLAGLACAMMEKYLDAAAYFRISGRLKKDGYAYKPELLQLAEKVNAAMAAVSAKGSNQPLEAAREALRHTIK